MCTHTDAQSLRRMYERSAMELGLIGNGAVQALVDRAARVRWLCWPRFDSSFVFGGLLDEELGGRFDVGDVTPVAQHYVDDTNVLRTELGSAGGTFEVLDFAPVADAPRRLVRVLRPLTGRPTVTVSCAPTYEYGRAQLAPQTVGGATHWSIGADRLTLQHDGPDAVTAGQAFELDRPVRLVLGWNDDTFDDLEAVDATVAAWRSWVATLALPSRFRAAVTRSALVLALHRYAPTGAITAASTTSLPEYPGSGRNWDYRFCWPRDAYFTLRALDALGDRTMMQAYLPFIDQAAQASDAVIAPLFGIGGELEAPESILEHLAGYRGERPVRIGNAAIAQRQHDVFGEILASVAPLASTSARAAALARQMLDGIEATMTEPDAGLWEIRDTPKLHTFSLLLHWYGATVAASTLGDVAVRARALAETARQEIEARCWRPELAIYGDAAETDHADAALLMMINLGYLTPSDPRAEPFVRALVERLSVQSGLLHRYLHDDGIGDTHATFTVCGFWLAEALARLGKHEEAEAQLERMLGYANHVGLYSEDVDPSTGGQLGNFPQTYSHAGLISAVLALEA